MADITSIQNSRKVAIIGVGNVGASIAYALTIRNLAGEIVLIDMIEERAIGEALDIQHGIPYMGNSSVRSGTYEDCADCDLIIITAGRNRKVGETRLDLARDNAGIMYEVIRSIKKYYTRGVILLISNPVDILTQKVSEWMDLPNGMVFGSGCLLDTSRFVRVVADYVGISTNAVSGYLIGEHGDGQVPVWSRVTIGGVPVGEYCSEMNIPWDKDVREKIAGKIRGMGAEIIKAKGKTHYGIATCVCYLADAILNRKPTIVSVTSPLMDEHGVNGVSLSVPSVIGSAGVQQRIKENWESDEYGKFLEAAEKVRRTLYEIVC